MSSKKTPDDDSAFAEHDIDDILSAEENVVRAETVDEAGPAIEAARKRMRETGKQQAVVIEGAGSAWDALTLRVEDLKKRAEAGEVIGVFISTIGPNEQQDGLLVQSEVVMPRLSPETLLACLEMNVPMMVGNAVFEVATKVIDSAVNDMRKFLRRIPPKKEQGS